MDLVGRQSGLRWCLLLLGASLAVAGCDDGSTDPPADTAMMADSATAADATMPDTQADTAPPDPFCGDGTRNGTEVCEGTDFGGANCQSEGFESGDLGCTSSCTLDTTACVAGPVCGNDLAETDERCDGIDLADNTCESEGYAGGVLLCNTSCDGFDTSACMDASLCGNGALNPDEVCDGLALDGATCETEGFDGGVLMCADDCTAVDTTNCFSLCGNDTLDTGEVCDGMNLQGETCATQGFGTGDLACDPVTCELDTAACAPLTCGNAMLDTGEACDGALLDGATCETEGFDGGTIACSAACSLDTADCHLCGDDAANGPEVCDGTDLLGATCLSRGFAMGELGCAMDCSALDESGCSGMATGVVPDMPGQVLITEIMYNPATTDDIDGEWIELHNPSTLDIIDIGSCELGDNGPNPVALGGSLFVPPGEYVTIAKLAPGFPATFTYDHNAGPQFGNGGDFVSLTCGATVIDMVDYDLPSFTGANGSSLALKASAYDATLNDDGANWCTSSTPITSQGATPDNGTPNAPNDCP